LIAIAIYLPLIVGKAVSKSHLGYQAQVKLGRKQSQLLPKDYDLSFVVPLIFESEYLLCWTQDLKS